MSESTPARNSHGQTFDDTLTVTTRNSESTTYFQLLQKKKPLTQRVMYSAVVKDHHERIMYFPSYTSIPAADIAQLYRFKVKTTTDVHGSTTQPYDRKNCPLTPFSSQPRSPWPTKPPQAPRPPSPPPTPIQPHTASPIPSRSLP